jgi:nucleoside-diphosphate-sugar epimerase
VIFHLAAAVPSEADADFARGYRGNVIATWALLDALRHLRHAPVFVFGSTTAVFGPPLPDQVPDAQAPVPQSSYGTQKAMAELLIADHGRHGYIDPISLRLPIVAGCPSAPSAAVARFVSDMICKPLAGRTADVPVPLDTRLWIASPEAVVADLLHAAALPADIRGRHRVLATPGLAVTPAQIVAALREVAGTDVAERVRSAPDAEVTRIVASWPGAMSCSAARALRFPADRGLRALILAQIAAQES